MSKIKEFIGETLIYGFANVFSRVFAMMLIPLYVGLGETDYSNLIMLQSIFSVLTVFLALNSGVFYYYYSWNRPKVHKMIFSSWFYYQLLIALVILFSFYLFAGSIKSIFIVTAENGGDLEWALVLVACQFFPYIINITNINTFRIQRKPKKVLQIVFLEALFTLMLIGGGLLFLDFGLIEIIASQFIGRLLVNFFFIKTARSYLNWKYYSSGMLKRLWLFSWPFFVISGFEWMILSVDKFIGVDLLDEPIDIATLALAMQLTIPIIVVADMIRMAIGPFIMSIHKEKNADQSYQQVFDISVFSGLIVMVGIIAASPLLTLVLANDLYLGVVTVVPLIAFSNVLSLISTQFSVNFSLVKKNAYLLIATSVAGISVISLNIILMREYGYIGSGIAQAVSSFLMAAILYLIGKRITNMNLRLRNTLVFISIVGIYVTSVYYDMENILSGNFGFIIFGGIVCFIILFAAYLLTYKKMKIADTVNREMD